MEHHQEKSTLTTTERKAILDKIEYLNLRIIRAKEVQSLPVYIFPDYRAYATAVWDNENGEEIKHKIYLHLSKHDLDRIAYDFLKSH